MSRMRPLLGLAALCVALACLLASLTLLLASDGSPTSRWKIQPTVYLAISTAISNTALRCALAQAAPISWWYKALKGSTIRHLEIEWEVGRSFTSAVYRGLTLIRGGRFMSLLAIANIATVVVLIDGPLLQRSSTVELAAISNSITLDIPISPELPTGFSGKSFPGHSLPLISFQISDAVMEIQYDVTRGLPIEASANCIGTCKTKVHGPGLVTRNCSQTAWPVTRHELESANLTWGDPAVSGNTRPFLYSNVEPDYAGVEVIKVQVGVLNYRNCTGQYVRTTCSYVPAIVEYDIGIRDRAISFLKTPSSAQIVALANNTADYSAAVIPLTFSAFALVEDPALQMNAYLAFGRNGRMPGPWYPSMTALVQRFLISSDLDTCTLVTQDPTDYIVSQLNKMMFRGGIMSGGWANTTSMIDKGLSVSQSVAAEQTQQENVFRSDLRWFAGAAALQILTILILLPVFWGWWEIGVDLSLSPFNTAKMMDAPLLRDSPSGTDVNGILTDLGSVEVKLGQIHDASNRRSSAVLQDEGDLGSRIGLAKADSITTIRRRYSFHSLR